MKYNFIIGLLVSFLVFTACSNQSPTQSQSEKALSVSKVQLTDSLKTVLIRRGENIAKQAQSAFQTALKGAIQSGGMEYAIGFCNSRALPITDSVSKLENVSIRRLAKKYRNPLNETNAAESEIYKNYVLAWLKRETLFPKIIPDEQGHPVYYKPIGIQPVCLNCHGFPGKDIPTELAKKIALLYPGDKATNFSKGELRGMWAITFPEYVINEK